MTIEKRYPDPLPKHEGRPLSEADLIARWQQIALFFRLNSLFPNMRDLQHMWSVSKPSAINTLRLLDERDLIVLVMELGGVQLGLTSEQVGRFLENDDGRISTDNRAT